MSHIVNGPMGLRGSLGSRVVLATLAVVITFAAGAAFAGDSHRPLARAGEPQSTLVRYGDLNIGRDQDARVLYGRLRAAAHRVCAPLAAYDLHTQQLQRNCYETTLADAVRRLGSERVAALHDGGDRRLVPVAVQLVSQAQ